MGLSAGRISFVSQLLDILYNHGSQATRHCFNLDYILEMLSLLL